ncbi:MAG: mechanosensitive ion channel family protein [Planctomycetes bacterium]|nr:mechanosensitive ion channel family protein [Planctomycetota bacterium]
MIEAFMEWLSESDHKLNLTVSAILVVCGIVGYLFARRRMLRHDATRSRRANVRIMGYIILLLELAILTKVWISSKGALSGDLYQSIYMTLLAAVITYLISISLQKVFLRNATTIEMRHKIRRAIIWGGLFVFIISAALIWAGHLGNISVFLGIIGAGIALSLQESLLCMVGWLLVIIKKPFDIGDRIEVMDKLGDVIDISLFQTSLLEVGNWVKADQSTGRMMIIPNSHFFRQTIFNYTKGFPFIWNELTTVVTFESDWKLAKEIMFEQASEEADKIESEVNRQISEMQREYAIHYENLRPIVYTSIADQGVELTLRYLSPVRQRRTTAHRISESILDAFIGHPTIDFAYPTTRIFRNNEEGKDELKPKDNNPGKGTFSTK